jgi:hypothetical protein
MVSRKVTQSADGNFKDELRLFIFDNLSAFQYKLDEVRSLWVHY